MRNPSLFLLLIGCGGTGPKSDDPLADCPDDPITHYRDTDGDGFGAGEPAEACSVPAGWSLRAGDCNDDDPAQFPDAEEQCDGIDNNCDGTRDEGFATSTFFLDADNDGFGHFDYEIQSCAAPPGYVDNNEDCDDGDPGVNPDANEICDGEDNNCDFLVDDDDPTLDLGTADTWYPDLDGDGYGAGDQGLRACVGPAGSAVGDTDCHDGDPDIHPAATEVCGGGDENCDGLLDDDDPTVDPATQSPWYEDADADGYGNAGVSADACAAPLGFVANPDDCDDADPAATLDQDWYFDGDGDGVGAGPSLGVFCVQPTVDSAPDELGIDCDDTDIDVYPGAVEICEDGVDQDCDSLDSSCIPYIGNFMEFADISSHSPDYLLGTAVDVAAATTISGLGVIGKTAGPNFQLALYSDLANSPDALVAQTASTSLLVGRQDVAITPVLLPAGRYWLMGIFETSASIGYDLSDASSQVDYISLSYGSAIPDPFGLPTVYFGQRFNYYLVVQ